jgi:hypothetical protein
MAVTRNDTNRGTKAREITSILFAGAIPLPPAPVVVATLNTHHIGHTRL